MQNCYPMLYMMSYGSPYTLSIYVDPYLGYSYIDFFLLSPQSYKKISIFAQTISINNIKKYTYGKIHL